LEPSGQQVIGLPASSLVSLEQVWVLVALRAESVLVEWELVV